MHRRFIELILAAMLLSGCVADRVTVRTEGPEPVADRAFARFERARQMIETGDVMGAETALVEFTARWPQYASGWTNLGVVYRQTSRDDLAVDALDRAMRIGADCVAANNLAAIRIERLELDIAHAVYRRCLDAHPGHAPSWLNLGVLYELYLGELPKALAAYERYQRLAVQRDPRVALWIADLHRRIDRSQHLAGGRP